MKVIEEIDNAISAHTAWLKNIKTAVAVSAMSAARSTSTQSINTITRIESDNKCAFGKWLYETIEPELKKTIYYEEATILHTQFHQQAASILSLAFKGKKSQANSLISEGSDFIICSQALIETLNKWKGSL